MLLVPGDGLPGYLWLPVPSHGSPPSDTPLARARRLRLLGPACLCRAEMTEQALNFSYRDTVRRCLTRRPIELAVDPRRHGLSEEMSSLERSAPPCFPLKRPCASTLAVSPVQTLPFSLVGMNDVRTVVQGPIGPLLSSCGWPGLGETGGCVGRSLHTHGRVYALVLK